MSTSITAFCLDWHITISNAFYDFLVNPLKPDILVKLSSWDGLVFPYNINEIQANQNPLIFCQLVPPDNLLQVCAEKLIWVPMLDHIKDKNQSWWNQLPSQLRIIAYSEHIYKMASAAGLQVLPVQYYPNPEDYPQAQFKKPITACYWNRRGVFSPELIESICRKFGVELLYFISKVDPPFENTRYYALPPRIGDTKVETISELLPQEEYKAILNQTDIYIAPRTSEGVGMTILEAMASGCMIIAYDAPTMNEYIIHKKSGYLMNLQNKTFLEKAYKKILCKVGCPDPYRQERQYLLNTSNKIEMITYHDMIKIANTCRDQAKIGYTNWINNIKDMKDFILD